jgi:hypothetical protein
MIYEPGFVVLNGVGRGAPVDMFECGRKRQIMLLLEKKV